VSPLLFSFKAFCFLGFLKNKGGDRGVTPYKIRKKDGFKRKLERILERIKRRLSFLLFYKEINMSNVPVCDI